MRDIHWRVHASAVCRATLPPRDLQRNVAPMRIAPCGVAIVVAMSYPSSASAQRDGIAVRPEGAATAEATVESLVRSPGAPWEQARSQHFVLYAERGEHPRYKLRALLDSLEAAWVNAERLLELTPTSTPPVPVFVTHSPARFPNAMSTTGRGVTITLPRRAGHVIILVHNDSSRAFTRHEVMHVMAYRLLGAPSEGWLGEGIATWADGRCGSTSIAAVAREQLRAEPGLTAPRFAGYFSERVGRSLGDRHAVYAMAGTLVASVYEHGGVTALRTLWRSNPTSRATSPLVQDTLTMRWRAYVERMSAGQPALPSERLSLFGCG